MSKPKIKERKNAIYNRIKNKMLRCKLNQKAQNVYTEKYKTV